MSAPAPKIHRHPFPAGLIPPITFWDRLLRRVWANPFSRFLMFAAYGSYQVVRVVVVEIFLKAIVVRGIGGGIARLLGFGAKPGAEEKQAQWTEERKREAGKRLLGPLYTGPEPASSVDDPKLKHGKLPGGKPGISLQVVEAGAVDDPDAGVVMLVHGFPESWFTWEPLLTDERMSRWHMVAVSLRGYGGSSRPTGLQHYTVKELTDDLKAVAEAVLERKGKKGGKTAVVAHDWGGMLSWAYTQRFPEMVSDLVIINCPPGSLYASNMTWRQLGKSWYVIFFQIPGLPELLLTGEDARGLSTMFPQRTADVHRFNALQPGAITAMVNYYRSNARTTLELPGKVQCRTLVIWGLNDIALDAATCLTGLPEHIMERPGDMEIRALDGIGHFVVDEVPDLVVGMVSEWLAGGKKTL
ncbi:Alpha/Beta hydrolase protein [Hyaloraphidium curvatum]|nr:Alpha/Beta hydrolase protein [Hyaloraphidium curvatum]